MSVLIATAACTGGSSEVPTAVDASAVDAPATIDAAAIDAAVIDALPIDALPIDAAAIDAAAIDAAMIDAAPPIVTGSVQLLESLPGEAWAPQVAVDPAGNAIAVWHQAAGTRDDVWAARYVAGAGWTAATLVEHDDVSSARYPQIALDAAGNAIASWSQSDGAHVNQWANRFVPDTGWGTPTLLETDPGEVDPFRVALAINATGTATATWLQSDGADWNVWANRFTAAGWGTAALVETDPAGDARNPDVAVDAAGNAIVAWTQFDGTRWNLWTSRFTAATLWGTPIVLETSDAGDAMRPDVAVEASGNATVLWSQSDGTHVSTWARRFAPAAGWAPASLLALDGGAGHVVLDTTGTATAVWTRADESVGSQAFYSLWSSRSTATSWAPATLLLHGGDLRMPELGVDSAHRVTAVWTDYGADDFHAARYTSSTGWSAAAPYDSTDPSDLAVFFPAAATAPAGHTVVLWSSGLNLWARVLP